MSARFDTSLIRIRRHAYTDRTLSIKKVELNLRTFSLLREIKLTASSSQVSSQTQCYHEHSACAAIKTVATENGHHLASYALLRFLSLYVRVPETFAYANRHEDTTDEFSDRTRRSS